MWGTEYAKGIIKRYVNVSAWMGYPQLVETTRGVVSIVKGVFTPAETTQIETFEEAMARLNLTEEAIRQRIKTFTYLALLWLLVGCSVLIYGVYLAGLGSWHGFAASVGVSLIGFAQAFRYHFWLFQMKQRRLGCTFKEWLNANFTGNKT